jgi:hypothetical protein
MPSRKNVERRDRSIILLLNGAIDEAAFADVLIINSRKFVHWKADRTQTAWSA